MNVTILFIYSKWRVLGIIQDCGREASVLMRCEPSFFNFYVYSLIIRCTSCMNVEREGESDRERYVYCASEMRPSNQPDATIKVKEQ